MEEFGTELISYLGEFILVETIILNLKLTKSK
jgi:hypothetical protein